MRILNIILFSIMLTSCGTIISGTDQNITVNAFSPLGEKVKTAQCYVRDSNQTIHHAAYGHNDITVQRSRHPIKIACLDDRFRTQTYNVHSYNNSERYDNIFHNILSPIETATYYGYADKTPNRITNNIKQTSSQRPNFIWDYRLGTQYIDYVTGAYWEYPKQIDIHFSSQKTITNYEYSHKPIPIPDGIHYVNLMD